MATREAALTGEPQSVESMQPCLMVVMASVKVWRHVERTRVAHAEEPNGRPFPLFGLGRHPAQPILQTRERPRPRLSPDIRPTMGRRTTPCSWIVRREE